MGDVYTSYIWKEIISNIYKELRQPNNKRWRRDLNRHFFKKDIQVTEMQIERCYHYFTSRNYKFWPQPDVIYIYKNGLYLTMTYVRKRVKKTKYSCTIGRAINWYKHFGNMVQNMPKKLKIAYDPVIQVKVSIWWYKTLIRKLYSLNDHRKLFILTNTELT